MQLGSPARVSRKEGPAVWQFRWSEKGLHGTRIQRKRVIGTEGRRSELLSATVEIIQQRQAPLSGSPVTRITEKKL